MNDGILQFAPLDVDAVEVLLCDADGNLFGSEEPAFAASATVTNQLLAELGVEWSFTADALRRRALGKNFRSTATELAADAGVAISPDVLEVWVQVEQREVVAHLAEVLRPDPEVSGPLRDLARRFPLAVVTSSAQSRLAACLAATDLAGLFPSPVRFCAEDSLPVATSKPDPAIYRFAGEQLGIARAAGLAVEDAVAGVRSAVAAGFPTVGNLQFVAAEEREERIALLRDAGVVAVVASWSHLAHLLDSDVAATLLRRP